MRSANTSPSAERQAIEAEDQIDGELGAAGIAGRAPCGNQTEHRAEHIRRLGDSWRVTADERTPRPCRTCSLVTPRSAYREGAALGRDALRASAAIAVGITRAGAQRILPSPSLDGRQKIALDQSSTCSVSNTPGTAHRTGAPRRPLGGGRTAKLVELRSFSAIDTEAHHAVAPRRSARSSERTAHRPRPTIPILLSQDIMRSSLTPDTASQIPRGRVLQEPTPARRCARVSSERGFAHDHILHYPGPTRPRCRNPRVRSRRTLLIADRPGDALERSAMTSRFSSTKSVYVLDRPRRRSAWSSASCPAERMFVFVPQVGEQATPRRPTFVSENAAQSRRRHVADRAALVGSPPRVRRTITGIFQALFIAATTGSTKRRTRRRRPGRSIASAKIERSSSGQPCGRYILRTRSAAPRSARRDLSKLSVLPLLRSKRWCPARGD